MPRRGFRCSQGTFIAVRYFNSSDFAQREDISAKKWTCKWRLSTATTAPMPQPSLTCSSTGSLSILAKSQRQFVTFTATTAPIKHSASCTYWFTRKRPIATPTTPNLPSYTATTAPIMSRFRGVILPPTGNRHMLALGVGLDDQVIERQSRWLGIVVTGASIHCHSFIHSFDSFIAMPFDSIHWSLREMHCHLLQFSNLVEP